LKELIYADEAEVAGPSPIALTLMCFLVNFSFVPLQGPKETLNLRADPFCYVLTPHSDHSFYFPHITDNCLSFALGTIFFSFFFAVAFIAM